MTLVAEKPTAKRLMSRYASLLDSSLFKVLLLNLKWIYKQPLSYQAVVLTITAGLLAFGIYGSVNIVQRFEIIIEEERLCQEKTFLCRFDPIRMLPRGNYLSEWIHTQNQYWPSYGLQVQVWFLEKSPLYIICL